LFLLLLSLFSSSPIGAHPVSQATITPVVFNYLPFVAKHWPPTPTPTVTPTPTPTPKPCPQFNAGQWERPYVLGANFTVSSDRSRVEDFEWENASLVINTCGVKRIVVPELPISNCQIEYTTDAIQIRGTFTSMTWMEGTYSFSYTGCSAWGSWISQWVPDTGTP